MPDRAMHDDEVAASVVDVKQKSIELRKWEARVTEEQINKQNDREHNQELILWIDEDAKRELEC